MYNENDRKKKQKNSKKRKKTRFFFFPFVRESDSKLEKTFAKLLRNDLFLAFVFIIVGLIFNFITGNQNILSIISGILFLIYAVVEFLYFLKRDLISLFKGNIVYAIGSLLLGIFVLINTFVKMMPLNKAIAIWYIYIGLLCLVKSFQLNSLDKKSFTMMLVTSLTTFFLAVVLFINPFKNLLENQVIGVYLILYGLLHANIIVLLRSRARRILEKLNK